MEHFERVMTADGSHSLYVPHLDEHYHSQHGAIQESMHVFIDAGLYHLPKGKNTVRIFEVGFGTGLNALLTAVYAHCCIEYTGIEKFPLPANVIDSLNYCARLGNGNGKEIFAEMHACSWNEHVQITAEFALTKLAGDMHVEQIAHDSFDLCYFDAFGFRAQPDMWVDAVFEKCYDLLAPGGVLTTYAAKGDVRRSMLAMGFLVEKLPGPPGKREMMRATKPFGK